jgi:anthranilate synthase/aminodeoxychorismate synthase-like glutamine amidotransferase
VSKQIVVIDNYDSFTYNLVQYVESLGVVAKVYLNDCVSVDDIRSLAPQGLLLSPGPGTPNDAGITLEAIGQLGRELPIVGVCLGHQAIGQSFGGRVVRASRLMHGKTSLVEHDGKTVYLGMPNPFEATRYHSLIVEEPTIPTCLEVSARTTDGEVMGLRHRSLPIEGVQFHPESFLTEQGMRLVANWVKTL